MMFIAVDLPDPLGPIMATNSPLVMVRSTPPNARTSASPDPYTLVTPDSRIKGGDAASFIVVPACP